MRDSELLTYDLEQILRGPFCGMTTVIVCEKSRKRRANASYYRPSVTS